VVRKLKLHFNVSFDELYSMKEYVMNRINDWRETLRSVLNELSYDDADEFGRCVWSPSENPELDLPESKNPEQLEVICFILLF